MRIFRLLKADKLQEPSRLLGFLTNQYIDEFITMASLNRRVGKSTLLREIVEQWMLNTGDTPIILVNRIAEHCFKVWQVSYSIVDRPEEDILIKFKRDLKQDLASRKISDSTIVKIIKKFDDFRAKDASRKG